MRLINLTILTFTFRWFAKRFLHPSIVSIYDYIFLWDEDLGVKNFHPGRYCCNTILKHRTISIAVVIMLDICSTGDLYTLI